MLTIAIPNKGRLYSDTVKLLEKIGLEMPENSRKLYVNTNNLAIQIVYARAADIPFYVQAGVADLGVTGEDMVSESEAKIEKLLRLNFGTCRIVVAAPKNSSIKSVQDYNDSIRVATKLVNITKSYFSKKNKFVEIIRLSGAVESAPALGIADLIIDQASTGTTLAVNNLEIIDEIFVSDVYLIANKTSLAEKEKETDEIKIALESVITAEQKRYIMANITSESSLKQVISSMQSMESPTILNLAKKGEYAIHAAINSAELISAIRKMKKAGAKDILVMNVSRAVE